MIAHPANDADTIANEAVTQKQVDVYAATETVMRDDLGLRLGMPGQGLVMLAPEVGRAEENAALRAVGLENRLDHFPAQLSGGEQQRVAIARAISKQPDLLLCDEPTGALDSQTGILVLEALDRVNRELGALTVVITHNAVIADMADRVLHLSDGRIVDERRNAVRRPARELQW